MVTQETFQIPNQHTQEPYFRDQCNIELEPTFININFVPQYKHHPVVSDTQPLLDMPNTVSDSYLESGVFENYIQSQNTYPVNSFPSVLPNDYTNNHNSINTEATVYDNYLPKEPDIPLSEVISEAFTVLGLNVTTDFNSTGEYI